MNRWLVWLLFGLSASLSAAESADEPISYQLTLPSADSQVKSHGATVYEKLGRSGFDREPMVEIVSHNRPKNLPPPDVVAYIPPTPVVVGLSDALLYTLVKSDGQLSRRVGEDRVFYQIREADRRGRCFLLAEGCDGLIKQDAAPSP